MQLLQYFRVVIYAGMCLCEEIKGHYSKMNSVS